MHDSGAAVQRAPDRSGIQEIVTVDAVIADDIMTGALQMSRYRGTHVTAMPRDQNAHNPMIGRRSAAVPTVFTSGKGRDCRHWICCSGGQTGAQCGEFGAGQAVPEEEAGHRQ
jgi:hypothetical protein